MASITRVPFVRHLSTTPTAHVRHERNGKLVHNGRGLAFWFRPLADELVVFGDGIEADHLDPSWGQQLTIDCAEQRLHLVVAR